MPRVRVPFLRRFGLTGNDFDEREVFQPLFERVADRFRDAYCEVAPSLGVPLGVFNPANDAINREICRPTQSPFTPYGGRCDAVLYNVLVRIQGTNSQGLTLISDVPVGGDPVEVWGLLGEFRVTPSPTATSRWRVECFCRGRGEGPGDPDWVVLGSSDVGFDRTQGAVILDVLATRADGLPDNCGSPPVPGGFQPGDILPTQIILNDDGSIYSPSYEIPITIAPDYGDGGVPRFSLDLEGQEILVEVTPDGFEFIYGDDVQETVNNIQDQITNENIEQTEDINQNTQTLIEQATQQLLEAIEGGGGGQCPDVDLTPISLQLEQVESAILNSLAQNFSAQVTAIQAIQDSVNELALSYQAGSSELMDEISCLEAIARASLPDELESVPVQVLAEGEFQNPPGGVVYIALPAGSVGCSIELGGLDSPGLRVYKLNMNPDLVEAGFGHATLCVGGGQYPWAIGGINVLSSQFSSVLAPNLDIPWFIRLSLKERVSYRVSDLGLRYKKVEVNCG